MATLFWYMSDVHEGGWTYFPRAGKLPNPRSYKLKKMSDCADGLKVPPRKGAVILFYSMMLDVFLRKCRQHERDFMMLAPSFLVTKLSSSSTNQTKPATFAGTAAHGLLLISEHNLQSLEKRWWQIESEA